MTIVHSCKSKKQFLRGKIVQWQTSEKSPDCDSYLSHYMGSCAIQSHDMGSWVHVQASVPLHFSFRNKTYISTENRSCFHGTCPNPTDNILGIKGVGLFASLVWTINWFANRHFINHSMHFTLKQDFYIVYKYYLFVYTNKATRPKCVSATHEACSLMLRFSTQLIITFILSTVSRQD